MIKIINIDNLTPLWHDYYAGHFGQGQYSLSDSPAPASFGLWRKYIKEQKGQTEFVLPCCNKAITPAIAAKTVGLTVSVKVDCLHQLANTRSLLFKLAGKIVPATKTIDRALKELKISPAKIADVSLPSIDSNSIQYKELNLEKPSILALPSSSAHQAFESVIHIASLAYNACKGFNLVVCLDDPKEIKIVNELEYKFNSQGMTLAINKADFTVDNVGSSFLALNGPEPIDDPLTFIFAEKMGIKTIAGSALRVDFPDAQNCVLINTEYKRQFAVAVYAELKCREMVV